MKCPKCKKTAVERNECILKIPSGLSAKELLETLDITDPKNYKCRYICSACSYSFEKDAESLQDLGLFTYETPL